MENLLFLRHPNLGSSHYSRRSSPYPSCPFRSEPSLSYSFKGLLSWTLFESHSFLGLFSGQWIPTQPSSCWNTCALLTQSFFLSSLSWPSWLTLPSLQRKLASMNPNISALEGDHSLSELEVYPPTNPSSRGTSNEFSICSPWPFSSPSLRMQLSISYMSWWPGLRTGGEDSPLW